MNKDELIDNLETLDNPSGNHIRKSKGLVKFLLSSVLFGFGYIIVLVNGYYYCKYYEFIQIGRKDLIVRLDFLSYAIGSIFYPSSLLVYSSLIWTFNRKNNSSIIKKVLLAILGLSLPGTLFYLDLPVIHILFGSEERIVYGIVIVIISIIMLSKTIKNSKSEVN